MARLGPFEARPHLAVAVSGGADSMALCLLAQQWASGQGGRVTALIVNHNLRPQSLREARQTSAWLKARRIDAHILTWHPPGDPGRGKGGVQAAARNARYHLLTQWCARHHILHLLLAHHRDDQAETVALRQHRASGVVGLSGMAAAVYRSHLRILRPLLRATKRQLQHFLTARGQGWIDDPSNRDSSYLRVQIRGGLDRHDIKDLVRQASIHGRARARSDVLLAGFFAQAATIYAEGYVALAGERLMILPKPLAVQALARVVQMVGGDPYPPGQNSLERLWSKINSGLSKTVTLGGCLLVPFRGQIWVCREWKGIGVQPLMAAKGYSWDQRLTLEEGMVPKRPLQIKPLAMIARPWPIPRDDHIPIACYWALPCLTDAKTGRIVRIAEFGQGDGGMGDGGMEDVGMGEVAIRWRFTPRYKLASIRFTVA